MSAGGAALLRSLVDTMRDLVPAVNFDVDEEGITIQALDATHVCLVDMRLRADGFPSYACGRTHSMGIHLRNLSTILRCAGNDDTVELERESEDVDTLRLIFTGPRDDRRAEYDLKLMQVAVERIHVPDGPAAIEATLPSREFQRICNDLVNIGDAVTISGTGDCGLRFSTSGDVGTANMTCRSGPLIAVHEHTPCAALTFALRYLTTFGRAASLTPAVRLTLSEGQPIVVEYDMDGVGHLRFVLAPKQGEEEEEEEEGGV